MNKEDFPLSSLCDNACFYHCTENHKNDPVCLVGKIIHTKIAGKDVYRKLELFNGKIGVKTTYDFLPWDILKVDSTLLDDKTLAKLYVRGALDHFL